MRPLPKAVSLSRERIRTMRLSVDWSHTRSALGLPEPMLAGLVAFILVTSVQAQDFTVETSTSVYQATELSTGPSGAG